MVVPVKLEDRILTDDFQNGIVPQVPWPYVLWNKNHPLELTIIIPAHNEDRCIRDTVNSIWKQTIYLSEVCHFKVLVGNDDSEDNTIAEAQVAGATVINLSRQGMKAGVIDELLKYVFAWLLLVLDADVKLDPHCLEYLIPPMALPNFLLDCLARMAIVGDQVVIGAKKVNELPESLKKLELLIQEIRTAKTVIFNDGYVITAEEFAHLLDTTPLHKVFCASPYLVPQFRQTWIEMLRTVQYIIYLEFRKFFQNLWTNPFVASGCCLLMNVPMLNKLGGIRRNHPAEDMHTTVNALLHGWDNEFVRAAICKPIDPKTLWRLIKQEARWYRGFWWIMREFFFKITRNPGLAFFVGLTTFEFAMSFLAWLRVALYLVAWGTKFDIGNIAALYMPKYVMESWLAAVPNVSVAMFFALGCLVLPAVLIRGWELKIETKVLVIGWALYLFTAPLELGIFSYSCLMDFVLNIHQKTWTKGHADDIEDDQSWRVQIRQKAKNLLEVIKTGFGNIRKNGGSKSNGG